MSDLSECAQGIDDSSVFMNQIDTECLSHIDNLEDDRCNDDKDCDNDDGDGGAEVEKDSDDSDDDDDNEVENDGYNDDDGVELVENNGCNDDNVYDDEADNGDESEYDSSESDIPLIKQEKEINGLSQ